MSATKVYFEEVQRFGNPNTLLVVRLLTLEFLFALLINLVIQKGAISNLTQGLLVCFMLCLLFTIFCSVKMVTQVREDGIYVKYFPFRRSFNRYSWNDISELHIREYNALSEYTGWGLKIGPSGLGYIVGGKYGIQLELREGPSVLIGTQDPETAAAVLRHLKQM